MKNIFKNYKTQIITLSLMVVIGTLMHFVVNISSNQIYRNIIGVIFPINESSWEHMKMIWYPFLVAGIVLSIIKKDKGYFGGFVIGGFFCMLTVIAFFTFYQSFSGTSILAIDIIIFLVNMVGIGLLSFQLAKLEIIKKWFIVWIVAAVLITALIITLTYVPGKGYIFQDDEGLHEHHH